MSQLFASGGGGTATIGGSGTANYFPVFTDSVTIGNSSWKQGSNGELQYQGASFGTAASPLANLTSSTTNGVGLRTDSSSRLFLSANGADVLGLTNGPDVRFFDGIGIANYFSVRNLGTSLLFTPNGATTGLYNFVPASGATATNLRLSSDGLGESFTATQYRSNDGNFPYASILFGNNRNLVVSTKGGGAGTNLNTSTGALNANAWTIVGKDTTNIGGTTTANASTTITGSSTKFTQDLGLHDRISLSSASSTYAYVTAIASDTSLTVSTALGNGSSQTINKKQALLNLQNPSYAEQFFVDDLGNVNVPGLTASKLVATDSSKNLVSSSMAAPTFTAISSNVTLVAGSYNFVSTAAARSLTLPAPFNGCIIKIKDKTGTASTNNITIIRAGSEKIEGVAASYIYATDYGSLELVSDGTDWWLF